MRKTIIVIIGILLLGAGIGYLYLYQGHRDISQEEAAYRLTAENLTLGFQKDTEAANRKYLNQVIEVTGIVKEVTDSTLLLEPGVFAVFKEPVVVPQPGTRITLKGRCIGYDELFGEVKLDQSVRK